MSIPQVPARPTPLRGWPIGWYPCTIPKNHIVYDSVLVITDRVVVDRQLQDAIKRHRHKSGLVCTIDDKKTSADLADALKGNYKIIVTTIQKFLYVDFWSWRRIRTTRPLPLSLTKPIRPRPARI